MVPPPHMRGNGHDDFSRRPPMPNHFKGNGPMEGPKLPKSPEEIKKEAQKREKKLKRILTDNQYNIWKEFLEKNPRHKDHKVL